MGPDDLRQRRQPRLVPPGACRTGRSRACARRCSDGKNDLTWWQGRTITLGYGLGEDVIADANYRVVAVVRAGNGLQADEHEFNVTPQGTAYILAYSPVQASLASAGGPASGHGRSTA